MVCVGVLSLTQQRIFTEHITKQRSPGSYPQAVPLNSQYILFSHPFLISTFDQAVPKWVCLESDKKPENPLIHPLFNYSSSTHPWILSFFFSIHLFKHSSIYPVCEILNVHSPFHPSYFICIICHAHTSITCPSLPPFTFPLFIHSIDPSSIYPYASV